MRSEGTPGAARLVLGDATSCRCYSGTDPGRTGFGGVPGSRHVRVGGSGALEPGAGGNRVGDRGIAGGWVVVAGGVFEDVAELADVAGDQQADAARMQLFVEVGEHLGGA